MPPYAYTVTTSDPDLAAKVEMTKSSLDGLQDSVLVQTAKRVTDAAEANRAALEPFGVTATNNDELKAAAALFAKKKEAPREATIGRKMETLSLPNGIRAVRSIFRKEIDKMMTGFKKPNPDFYHGYFAARIIIDRGMTKPEKPEDPDAAAPSPAPSPAPPK